MTEKSMTIMRAHLRAKHNIVFYPYQDQIAYIILDALINNLRLITGGTPEQIKKLKRVEHAFEISRQAGKTTAVVSTIEFALIYLTQLFHTPIHIGIFAPQQDQAKTDFDRLKSLLLIDTDFTVKVASQDANIVAAEESNAKTLVLPNGSSCYIFPVTKTSKPESKSLHLMIFEEGQDLDDNIVKQQIFPMGASTNAPRIFIGTAGTQICQFYRMGQADNSTKIYYPDIVKQRRAVYEQTNNPAHLIYEGTVGQDIVTYGAESDEIMRPYFGKWLIGTGNFTTQEELEALIDPTRGISYRESIMECFAGLDLAKHPDSTVLTILRYNKDKVVKEIIRWVELRGENYQNQFEVITDVLKDYNVLGIAIDSTGLGDFMPDLFELNTKWQDENTGLWRVKFSQSSKDIIYKNLKASIKELLTRIPATDKKEGKRFVQQMLDLQQEYKGQFLTAHHPDDANAHDDYCDSWALAEYAYAKYNEGRVDIAFASNQPTKDEQTNGFFDPIWD